MRSRWLLNLALLGLILILVLLVMYEPGLDKPVESPKLTAVDVDQLKHLRVVRREAPVLEFEKDAKDQWQMTAPLTLPANSFRVERVLKILSERDYKSLDVNTLKLADLKLSPPEVQVSFDQLTVAFGDSSPMNDGRRYVQLSSQPQRVFLVRDDTYYSLIDKATSFVHLSPLGEAPKLTELKLPDSHLVLKNGTWTFATPVPDTIDSSTDALNGLIENWQRLQAIEVQSYAGNSETAGDIQVTLEGQPQPLRFVIQATRPELILARPDKQVQYKISSYQVEKLLHLPSKSLTTNDMATPSTGLQGTINMDDVDEAPSAEEATAEEVASEEEVMEEE